MTISTPMITDGGEKARKNFMTEAQGRQSRPLRPAAAEHNTVWMAGEQLKEIARSEPGSAELLAKDPGGQRA